MTKNNIDYIISPVKTDVFFEQYWDKETLLIKRNDVNYYRDIITVGELDTYLSRNDITFPFVRMANKDNTVSFDDYAFPSSGILKLAPRVEGNKLFDSFNNGYSIVVQRTKFSLESLNLFLRGLEETLGVRAETNIFITPAQSQGFKAHFDRHNVFVLQISGSKSWNLYDINRQMPLDGEPITKIDYSDRIPARQLELNPGDMLYIPRGMVHEAATTNEGSSIHLTVTLHPYSWAQLLKASLESQKDSELLKPSLLNIDDEQEVNYHDQYADILKKYLDSIEF